MNDIELAALTELVETQRFEMEAENTTRERSGYALAYSGDIDWPERDALEKELRIRGIIKKG